MVTWGEASGSFSIDHLSCLPADLLPLSLPLPWLENMPLRVFVCLHRY